MKAKSKNEVVDAKSTLNRRKEFGFQGRYLS